MILYVGPRSLATDPHSAAAYNSALISFESCPICANMLTVNLDTQTSENAFICKGCPYQYPIKKLVSPIKMRRRKSASGDLALMSHHPVTPNQYLERETFEQKAVDVSSEAPALLPNVLG